MLRRSRRLTAAGVPRGRIDPRTLGTLLLWFDADDAATITQATGVSQWNDKSGNGNNATQATGSAQPTLQTAAQNGRNTLRFTAASSQVLTLGSSVSIASGYTQVAVVRRGGPSGSNAVHVLGKAGASNFSLRWHTDDRLSATSLTKYQTSSLALGVTGYQVISSEASSADVIRQFLAGSLVAGGTSVGLGSTAFDQIGKGFSTEFCNGEVAEVLLYSGVLSDTARASAENYLKGKWGVP